jgi:general stress protein YciG
VHLYGRRLGRGLGSTEGVIVGESSSRGIGRRGGSHSGGEQRADDTEGVMVGTTC